MRRAQAIVFIICMVIGLMSAAAVSGIVNLNDRVTNIKYYDQILPMVYADYCPEGIVLPGVCDPLPSQGEDLGKKCAEDPNCGDQQLRQKPTHYPSLVCDKYAKYDNCPPKSGYYKIHGQTVYVKVIKHCRKC